MGTVGTQGRLGYRPELDGLRGLAVLAVAGFHADLIPGGWVGVDIFFVLSGFLITTLLFEEVDRTGTVDLAAFWGRRIRRLMPALAVLLLGVGAWAWTAEGADAEMTRAIWPTAALYSSNWLRAMTGMFGGALGHTWSLAVEEQFYLLWPVAFAALAAPRKVRRAAMAVTVAVVLWRLWLLSNGAADHRLYNGTDTRADALMVGVVSAVLRRQGSRIGRWWPVALTCLLATALIAPQHSTLMYGGGLTIIAGSAALLILALVDGTAPDRLHRMLSSRVAVWFGTISYALYLWHEPLQRGARGLGLPAVVGVAVAVPVAWASTQLVEDRFRRRAARGASTAGKPEPVHSS